MPFRKYNQVNSSYRYGFNGKENDNDVKGQGNQQDYGMRIYDPRTGKFLSADPLTQKYPFYSPYQFAGNNPIFAIDVDGLEPDKILNKAESLLNTPYEFGGTSPAPELIGSLATKEGRSFWETSVHPALRLISDYHPQLYKQKPGAICSKAEVEQQSTAVRTSVY